MPTPTIEPLMQCLRHHTEKLHAAVENHPFQKSLALGRLPQESYAAYLGQMFCVHVKLEPTLVQHSHDTRLWRVVSGHQFKTPYLLADLEHFHVPIAEIQATPGCLCLINEIERAASTNTCALLGYHYVLEGSTNGGKFIARVLSKTLGLRPYRGLAYLDPYGEMQSDLWTDFKNRMNSLILESTDSNVILSAAASMFKGVERILDDLWASQLEEAQHSIDTAH